MKKILFIIGTRPEAIKLSPLLKVFQQEQEYFNVLVCHTGQHRELVEEVLDFFDLIPNISLNPKFKATDGLAAAFAILLNLLSRVIDQTKPDLVVVQGDTSSAMAGALGAYYSQVKVAHVEAGLRTYDHYYPFPEEMNRGVIARLANFHFAPTEKARLNLLKENIHPCRIEVTGNTGIDALRLGLENLRKGIGNEVIKPIKSCLDASSRLILITLHRRESHGKTLTGMCRAIKKIAEKQSIQVLFPVHPNPMVRTVVEAELSGYSGVILVPPLSYPAFLWAMQHSSLILTDSGGIQEEAPSIGKRVILLRNQTERPEAVKSGHVQVVGTQPDAIIEAVDKSLSEETELNHLDNPFGDGFASERILAFLKENL